jgi:type II secretory pathway component PulM
MSLDFRQLDPKTRRLVAIGNLCLVAGLLLWLFVHPSSQLSNTWLHAIYGFLLGLSTAINLSAVVIARRCNRPENPRGNSLVPN